MKTKAQPDNTDLQEKATVAVSAEVCEVFAHIHVVQNFYCDVCALDIG